MRKGRFLNNLTLFLHQLWDSLKTNFNIFALMIRIEQSDSVIVTVKVFYVYTGLPNENALKSIKIFSSQIKTLRARKCQ